MEENKNVVENKKSNKGLIIILIIIILGLAGYICYDKFIKKTEEPKIEEKEEAKSQEELLNDEDPDEDNSEAISICNNNRDLIVKTLKEKRSNDFIAKYYPNNLKNGVWSYYYDLENKNEWIIGNPDDLDCSTAWEVSEVYEEYKDYIKIEFSTNEEGWGNSILFNKNNKTIIDFYVDIEEDLELDDMVSSRYAVSKFYSNAVEKYENDEFVIKVFPLDYDGGDTRDFMICNFGEMDHYEPSYEKDYCVAKYTYNYKTDSFSVEELNK